MSQSAASSWTHLHISSSMDGCTRGNPIFTTTTCAAISFASWPSRTRKRNIGKPLGVVSMCMERGYSSGRPRGATTSRWKRSSTKRQRPRGSGRPSRKEGDLWNLIPRLMTHLILEPYSKVNCASASGGLCIRTRRTKSAPTFYCRGSQRSSSGKSFFSAITTGGFIAAVFGAGKMGALVGLLVSTALLVLNAYTKNYDLGELSQKHRRAGADLWMIREKYLSLITDLRMGEKPIEALQAERDNLLEALHSVYSGAPSTTYQAYKKAHEALKQARRYDLLR